MSDLVQRIQSYCIKLVKHRFNVLDRLILGVHVDGVPDFECDIEALLQKFVHRVCMFFLDLSKLAFIGAFALRVLSVTNLIVF